VWRRLAEVVMGSPFDLHAERYDAWFDSPQGSAIFAAELESIRALKRAAGGRWLEVGVGTGRFAERLGVDEGVDPSEEMLRRARARGITVRAATAEALPYPDSSWDGLLLVVTICFLDDPRLALAECMRVLKDGGELIVGLVPADSPWGAEYSRQGRQGHPFYSAARFYTCDEVIDLAGQAGLVYDGAASTLLEPPADDPPSAMQEPVEGMVQGAGFVALRFVKHAKTRRAGPH